jgi:hypothetical protein
MHRVREMESKKKSSEIAMSMFRRWGKKRICSKTMANMSRLGRLATISSRYVGETIRMCNTVVGEDLPKKDADYRNGSSWASL